MKVSSTTSSPLSHRSSATGLVVVNFAVLGFMGYLLSGCNPAKAAVQAYNIDFGDKTEVPGFIAVNASARFSQETGYGWVDGTDIAVRDRKQADDLERDFVMGRGPATFRVTGLAPGGYLLTIKSGDLDYGDHVTRVRVSGNTEAFPILSPATAEIVTLSATVSVDKTLDITFDSPQNNWVVNSLSLVPATTVVTTGIKRTEALREPVQSTWKADVFHTDPTRPLLEKFRADQRRVQKGFVPSGLTRQNYLTLITGQIDFWKKHQNTNGAIIDPYKKEEVQYSTPAFAHAAALLVVRSKRADLLEPASKAMDWATRRLSERQAANSHEDFYPTMLAHGLMLLKPQVAPERAARWEEDVRRFNPYSTYRQGMGSMNWNVVSLSGEALFQKMGLRMQHKSYVPDSIAAQGHHFGSPYGLYLEGPLAYDHFPRIFLADVLANGYEGPYRAQLAEALRRAALTSLFMQSPWGELPAGGRSAHHQWNEAEQCVTYEIYAAQALKAGDAPLAAAYKRAAHLALASMQRWVRPSGEMQIVKNWVDPVQRHAFEGYSAHSQYNLLPMSMLASAYEHAAATEQVAELPAPADIGGYVLEIPELHKVFANAGGTYVEIDTTADVHYDATGLIRVHSRGVSPQLGPSDSLLANPSYQSPRRSPVTTGIGVSWKDAAGAWRTLGELDRNQIKKSTVSNIAATAQRVTFDVTYEGELKGVSKIIEHYVLTPGKVELMTEIPGYAGPARYLWPVLANNGRTKSRINVANGAVSVSLDGEKGTQNFHPVAAASVNVETEAYSNHNGWARLGVAEYPQGGRVTFVISSSDRP